MIHSALFQQESEAMFKKLYQLSYGLLKNHADSEDAVQQGFMKAWTARNRADASYFRPWLTRIVINECRNIQRHRARVNPAEEVPAVQHDDSGFSLVMEALGHLAEKYQTVFSMKYITGHTEKEIAVALHLPVSTIKNRLTKARALMREGLNDREVSFE